MVPPSVEVSGLQNHVERFHANGAAESKHMEEEEEEESTSEKATDTKNSEK